MIFGAIPKAAWKFALFLILQPNGLLLWSVPELGVRVRLENGLSVQIT